MFSLFKKAPKIDNDSLNLLVHTIKMIKKLQKEDDNNFVCFHMFALNDNEFVSFKQAKQLFFKIIYCGSVVPKTWNIEDYTPYDEFRHFFNMFEEESGDYSFCVKVNIHSIDVAATISKALALTGYPDKVDPKRSDIFVKLLPDW